MNTIINLTQHIATQDQLEAGVVDLPAAEQAELAGLLTFNELPTIERVQARAKALARIAKDHGANRAMIGGAPYLMAPLESALLECGIIPVYAFSRRESVEQIQPDGSVRKINIFRHMGFVDMTD